jgi:hypothetical protein
LLHPWAAHRVFFNVFRNESFKDSMAFLVYRTLREWLGDSQEDREPRPVSLPTRADRGIVRIPRQGNTLQGRFGFHDRRRSIHGSQIPGHGTPLPPHHIPQGLSDFMHNAVLHLGARKDRLQRVGQPRQPINTGHETILDPSLLEIRKDRSPEFGAIDPEA